MLLVNQKYCCQKKDPSTEGESDQASSRTWVVRTIGSAFGNEYSILISNFDASEFRQTSLSQKPETGFSHSTHSPLAPSAESCSITSTGIVSVTVLVPKMDSDLLEETLMVSFDSEQISL